MNDVRSTWDRVRETRQARALVVHGRAASPRGARTLRLGPVDAGSQHAVLGSAGEIVPEAPSFRGSGARHAALWNAVRSWIGADPAVVRLDGPVHDATAFARLVLTVQAWWPAPAVLLVGSPRREPGTLLAAMQDELFRIPAAARAAERRRATVDAAGAGETGAGETGADELLRRATVALDEEELPACLATLDAIERRLRGEEVPVDDPRWGEGWLIAVEALSGLAAYDAAERWSERTVAAAQEHGWDHVLGRALRQLTERTGKRGNVERAAALGRRAEELLKDDPVEAGRLDLAIARVLDRQGERRTAMERCRRAWARLDATGNLRHAARARGWFGGLARQIGMLDEAWQALMEAEEIGRRIGDPVVVADALRLRTTVAVSRQDYATAARCVDEAVPIYLRGGWTWSLGFALNDQGEVRRLMGELEHAENCYRGAIAVTAVTGDAAQSETASLNLCQILVQRGQWVEARDRLREILEDASRAGRRGHAGLAHVLLLPCAEALGDVGSWDVHFAAVSELADGMVEPDMAEVARRAAELAEEKTAGQGVSAAEDGAGALVRAARARDVALRQWRALGRVESAVQEEGALRELVRRGSPIPLGVFDLVERIGAGSMGEVWRGVHRAQQVGVAVKVLTASGARSASGLAAFRAEVRALAGLDHPGIAMVWDHGTVGAAAHAMTRGSLVEGSPFLAMELARGGTLQPRCGHLSWDECRDVFLSLLDALAHAHARGVIHRDLKPQNVLFASSGSTEVRIVDFGIAHAVGGDGGSALIAGTPKYMAPEQWLGLAGDFGPWTDLYAFGCLAWAVVRGAPPYQYPATGALRRAHLELEPPPLAARMPIPSGLEPWLRRLLVKEPRDRFRAAADAACALALLGPAVATEFEAETAPVLALGDTDGNAFQTFAWDGPIPDRAYGGVAGPDVSEAQDPAGARVWTRLAAAEPPGVGSPIGQGAPAAPIPVALARPAPVPLDWRRPRAQSPEGGGPTLSRPARVLLGVGQGLYGLRRLPLVGRERERDALWSELVATARQRRARAVVLVGPAGAGTTRLGEWLGERAVETGAAAFRFVRHSATPGPRDGVAGMLSAHLRLDGVARAVAMARASEAVREGRAANASDWCAVVDLLLPDTDGVEAAARTRDPADHHQIALRALAGGTADRALVVLLDAVQWGADALDFALHVLGSQDRNPAPILFVLTAANDALADRPDEAQRLERLTREAAARVLEVGPLSNAEHAALVERLLGLEPELASQVVQRTRGNPRFAVELVGDWVERGLLVPGPSGFALRPGVAADLPAGLRGVWEARADRLFHGLPRAARAAAEVAAVLGEEVDRDTWTRACEAAGVSIPPGLEDRLVAAHFARPTKNGWSFVHGMLRESLLHAARESERSRIYHRACAEALGSGDPARLARHRFDAGDYEGSLQPLLAAIRACGRRVDLAGARHFADQYARSLDSLGAPENDPRRGESWPLVAAVVADSGGFDELCRMGEPMIRAAETHGWDALLPKFLALQARAERARGGIESARLMLRRATAMFEAQGDHEGSCRCLLHRAQLAQDRGDQSRAWDLMCQARDGFEMGGEDRGVALCLSGMADIALRRGEAETGETLFTRARGVYERSGDAVGVAICENGLADASRVRGELDRAETLYRKALGVLVSMAAGRAAVIRLNLGLLAFARGRFEEAAPDLRQAVADLDAQGRHRVAGAGHAMLVAATSLLPGDECEAHIAEARRRMTHASSADPDAAWAVELGARRARDAGFSERARASFELARDLWKESRRDDDARRVEQEMS